MTAQNDIPKIVEYVELQLKEAEKRGVHLDVVRDDTKLEDDWLYVSVTPQVDGERASDYADLMSVIERNLRKQGYENVLLVPTTGD